jgi:tetratricopeptide (TPR) repeat protein
MTALRASILIVSAAVLRAQVPDATLPDERDPDLPKLICRMAMFAQFNTDVPGAEKLVRHGISLFTRSDTLESPDGAACLNTLASILEWKGQAKAAQQELEHALSIRQQLFGPTHFLVADSLNRLGMTQFHQGHLQEAAQSHQRAIDILRQQGPSTELAAALNNLGNVLRVQNKWKEAEGSINEAVAMSESLLGPNDPAVAAALTNLGLMLESRKRYDEAARILARARAIDEKNLPPNHPRIGIDLNAAGVLATARKNYREAEDLLLKSLAILEKSLSPEHPDTGQVQLNLGEVYRLQKKLDQARESYKRGLGSVTAAWGPDDARLAQWMDNYAVVLRAQEDYAGAEALEIRATRIRVIHAIR